MAGGSIKGITIEIGGNTQGLQDALRGVNSESKKVQSELKEVERALKFDPGNTELLRQKQELLAQSIQQTSQKLDTLKTAQAQVEQQFRNGDIGAEQYRAFQRELANTEAALRGYENQLNSMDSQQDRFTQAQQKLQTYMQATGQSADDLASTLGSRLANAIRDGSASTDQMEMALNRLGRQAGLSGQDMERFHNTLRDNIGNNNLDEVRRDLENIGDATNDAEGKMGELGSAIGGLVAGGGIAGVVATALDAASLDAKIDVTMDVPEESKAAVKQAVMDVTKYGVDAEEALEAVRRQWALNGDASDEANARIVEGAGAIAAAYAGIDMIELVQEVNEIGAALGITDEEALALTNSLLKAGFPPEQLDIISEYGTQLSDAGYSASEVQAIMAAGIETGTWNIDNLLDGIKEGRIRVAEFGAEVPKALGDLLTQTDVSKEKMQEWGKAVAKGGEGGAKAMTEIAQWLSTIEDDTLRNALGTEIYGTMWEDQGSNITDTLLNMDSHLQTTEQNQKTLNDTVDGMNSDPAVQLKDAFNNMMIALTPLLTGIAEVVGKLASWAAENPALTATLAAIGTAIGIIVGAFAFLAPAIAAIMPLFASGGVAATAFGAVMAALTGPIGIAIGIIALLAGAAIALWKNWETVGPFFSNLWSGIKNVFSTTISSIASTVSSGFSSMISGAQKIFNNLASFFSNIWNNTKSLFSNSVTAIASALSSSFNKILSDTRQIFENLSNFLKNTWSSLTQTLSNFWSQLSDKAVSIFNNLKLAVTNATNATKSALSSAWQSAISLVQNLITGLKNTVSSIFNSIVSVVSSTANTTKSFLSNTWSAIVSTVSSAASNILNSIRTTFANVVSSISSKMSEAKSAVSNMFSQIVAVIKPSALVQAGRDLVQGLINGIKAMGAAAINAMTGLVNGVVNKAKSLLGIASPSKLFIQYGKWISEGLAIGITDDANKVEQAITSLVNSATTTAQKNISDIQGLVSKSNKTNAQEIAKIEKDLAAERLKITQEAQKKINDLRAKNNSTATADAKTLATKIADIEKKAAADEKKIRDAAAKAKKKLTKQQQNDIAKIHSEANANIAKLNSAATDKAKKTATESSKTIKEIEAKAGQDRIKASKKAGEQIAKVEGTLASDRMAALKADAEAKKQAGQLNAKAEADYWRYAATAFKTGSKEHTEAMKLYNTALANYNKERLDDIKNYISDKKSLDQLSLKDEVLIWQANIDAFEEGSKERLEAQKAYKTSLEALNKEITSINQTYQNEMQKINDDLIKQENDLTKAYDDAFKNRYNSLMSFAGLFDEFKRDSEKTGEELIDNLQGQVDGFRSWQNEFAKLSNRGIDADLLAELSGLGVKALPELMALNSLTDEQLTQYSELYRDKSRLAREQTEKEMAGMKKDTESQISELRKAANAELNKLQAEWRLKIRGVTQATSDEFLSLKQIGVDAGQGLLNGLASMQGPLINKAQQIANAIKSTIQSALDIHSPSRVMKGFGVNIGQGLVNGMDDMINKVAQSSARLSNAVMSAQSSLSNSAQLSQQQRPVQQHVQQANNIDLSSLVNAIIQLANTQPDINLSVDGRQLASVVSRHQRNTASLDGITKGVSFE